MLLYKVCLPLPLPFFFTARAVLRLSFFNLSQQYTILKAITKFAKCYKIATTELECCRYFKFYYSRQRFNTRMENRICRLYFWLFNCVMKSSSLLPSLFPYLNVSKIYSCKTLLTNTLSFWGSDHILCTMGWEEPIYTEIKHFPEYTDTLVKLNS